jgi:hypothetical protein
VFRLLPARFLRRPASPTAPTIKVGSSAIPAYLLLLTFQPQVRNAPRQHYDAHQHLNHSDKPQPPGCGESPIPPRRGAIIRAADTCGYCPSRHSRWAAKTTTPTPKSRRCTQASARPWLKPRANPTPARQLEVGVVQRDFLSGAAAVRLRPTH